MIKHYDILVFGRVQGVWFRKYTAQTARRLNLNGWVRNELSGHVRISVEGPEDHLALFLQWCHEGSPKAEVKAVEHQEAPLEYFDSFAVRHA